MLQKHPPSSPGRTTPPSTPVPPLPTPPPFRRISSTGKFNLSPSLSLSLSPSLSRSFESLRIIIRSAKILSQIRELKAPRKRDRDRDRERLNSPVEDAGVVVS
ncbi:hypothetical protein SLA2020_328810 [Shorea laevis]